MSGYTTTVPHVPVHPSHTLVAWKLLAQHRDLPAPTSITVSADRAGNTYAELAVDTAAQVDAWAEAMGVDMDSTLHNDSTWTDRATGVVEVVTGENRWLERVHITVYAPLVATTAHPVIRTDDGPGHLAEPNHGHLAATGRHTEPCRDPRRCAAEAATDAGEPLLDERGPDARNPGIADRIIRNMALRSGPEVNL